MKNIRSQSGFTAIELLITLFVAAAFLIASYQLFNVVIKDGGQARSESRAGNVAYDYMRRYSPSATNPCTAQTPLTNFAVNIDGLSNSKITVTISCPAYTTTSLSKVDVSISYNSPTETVKYATFVNGTGTQAADVTDGLIAWFKFNGDINSAIGSFSPSSSGITLTTGQNSLANNAYSFSGSGSYVSLGNNSIFNAANMTISAWVRPTSISLGTDQTIVTKELNYKYALTTSASTRILTGVIGTAWTVNSSFPTAGVAAGSWAHVVMTRNSDVSDQSISLYVNGTFVNKTSVAPITTFSSNNVFIGAFNASGSNPFIGSIDDVRFYNRVLSGTEITTLYTGGGK